jgi:cell cycle checkpoint protein
MDDSYEALMTKFETFFNRASNCQAFLAPLEPDGGLRPSQPGPSRSSNRRIILLEDLPNVLHLGTQAHFHAVLRAFVDAPPSDPPVPIVIIISDAQTVGEANDERVAQGRRRNAEGEGVVDIRTVLPRDLLGGAYATQIRYGLCFALSWAVVKMGASQVQSDRTDVASEGIADAFE